MDCLEILGSITNVYPIELGVSKCSVPFNAPGITMVSAKTITLSGATATSVSDLISKLSAFPSIMSEGVYSSNAPEGSIMATEDISAKASSKVDINGKYYTVKITAKTMAEVEELKLLSDKYRLSSFDCYIIDSNQSVYLIRGAKRSASLTISPSLPLMNGTDIELECISVNGIQKIE